MLTRLSDGTRVVIRRIRADDKRLLAAGLGLLVAVARYVRLPADPATADAAIVVGDPWQRRGLGRRLAIMLADAARLQGIERFSATMLSDNPAALALMRTLAQRLERGE